MINDSSLIDFAKLCLHSCILLTFKHLVLLNKIFTEKKKRKKKEHGRVTQMSLWVLEERRLKKKIKKNLRTMKRCRFKNAIN